MMPDEKKELCHDNLAMDVNSELQDKPVKVTICLIDTDMSQRFR